MSTTAPSPAPLDIVAVSAPGAPPPGGHYSQAIAHGGLVYVSGQLPVQAGQPHDPKASFKKQARQALANLCAILAAADSGPDRLLKVTAYIAGVENWPAFNAVYAEALGDARPARSVVPVPHLHYGYLVEVEAVAAQNPK